MLQHKGLSPASTSRPGRARRIAIGPALATLLMLFGAAGFGRAQSPRTAGSVDAFVAALQKKYASTRDFTATFSHAYEGGVLRTRTTERGQVMVKKPGKMRWTYEAPEPKVFVSDGTRIYSYVPADRQVIVSRVPEGDQATTPIQFLVGRGDVRRDFTAAWTTLPQAPDGVVALELVPKQRQPEYDALILGVDETTLALRVLRSTDSQGGTSTFTFSNWKENVGLDDRRFEFTIPKGTDVINQ